MIKGLNAPFGARCFLTANTKSIGIEHAKS